MNKPYFLINSRRSPSLGDRIFRLYNNFFGWKTQSRTPINDIVMNECLENFHRANQARLMSAMKRVITRLTNLTSFLKALQMILFPKTTAALVLGYGRSKIVGKTKNVNQNLMSKLSTKTLTLIAFGLFFMSQNSIAQNVNFDAESFVDAADFGSGIYTSGNIRITLSGTNWTEQTTAGESGTQALFGTVAGTQTVTVETIDGSELDFQSFYTEEYGGFQIIQAEGFKDAGSTGVQTTGFPTSTTATVTLSNAFFDDVDQMVITSHASGFSSVFDSFVFGPACAAPTAQATSAVFGTENSTTLDLTSWTAPAGGATGYAVYINSTNSFTAPSDGDEPVADLSWNGAGQQPIYFGTSASPSLTVTGLSASSTYFFQIYSYNDCSGVETYETIGLNASDLTGAGTTPCSFDSNDNGDITSGNFSSDTGILSLNGTNFGQSFTACATGNLNSIELFTIETVSDITVQVYDGAGNTGSLLGTVTPLSSTAASVIGDRSSLDVSSEGISVISGQTYTLYVSSVSALTTRLTNTPSPGSIYSGGQAYNGNTSAPTQDLLFGISVASSCAAPTAQATSAVLGTSTFSTQPINSWTAPAGGATGYVVIMNTSASFTTPTDGTSPAVNTSYISGEQVVYNGTSATPNITITNLSPSTTYHYRVYSYNDCSGTETYESTGLDASQATIAAPTLTCTDENTTGAGVAAGVAVFGQSFTTTCGGQLSSITVGIDDINTGSDNVVSNATISVFNGTDFITGLVGSALTNVTINEFGTAVFDFTNAGVTLADATQYTFIVEDNSDDSQFGFDVSSSNPYAGGELYINSVNGSGPVGSTASTGDDLVFSVNIVGAPTFTTTWLDENPTDGTIDRVRLDFSENVTFTDVSGSGDVFDAISISGGISLTSTTENEIDFATLTAVTSYTFDITGASGSSDPNVDVTYNASATNNSITGDVSGLEIEDADTETASVDGAIPVFVSAQTTSTTNIAIIFSEDISSINGFADFTSADFTASAANIDGGDASIINLTVNAIAGNFTSTDLDIAAGAVSDGTNANLIIANASISDGTLPTFVSAEATSLTNIAITFSEDVSIVNDETDFTSTGTDFTASSVAVDGGDASVVNLTVNALSGTDFTSTDLDIAAGAVSDGTNTNAIITDASISDGISPTFVSAQTTSTTNIAITFSEDISSINGFADFTSADFTASAANIDGGDASIINLTVNALAGNFTSTDLDIAAGAVSDGTNANLIIANASISDGTLPTFVSAEATSLTNIAITFSEDVSIVTDETDFTSTGTDFTASSVAVDGVDASIVNLTVNALSGTDFTSTDLDIAAGALSDGTNTNAIITDASISDGISPTIVSAQTTSTTNIAITFSEDISSINGFADFTSADFTASAANIDGGDASIINLTVNAVAGSFTSTDLDIAAGAVSDGTNANLIIANASISDGIIPTFVSAEATSLTNIAITFSEDVSIVTDETGFTSTGTDFTASSVAVDGVDASIVNLTVNALSGTDFTSTDLDIAAGAVSDGTNTNAIITDASIADAILPTVIITRLTPSVENTVSGNVIFRVTFSEPVQNVDASDFDVDNGTITGETVNNVNQQSTSIYDITIDSYSGTGSVILDFFASQNIQDLNSNAFDEGSGITSSQTYSIVAPDTNSDIVAQSGYSFASFIDPTSNANGGGAIMNVADGVKIAGFTIRDGGGATDTDDVGTTLTDLTLTIANHTNIESLAIFDGTTLLDESAVTTASLSFTGLSIAAVDNGSKDFDIYVTFKSDGGIIDNNILNITITNANVTAAGTGSDFSAFASADMSPTGNQNQIAVGTNSIVITSEPTAGTAVASTFSIALEARDSDGNVDVDFAENATLTINSGPGGAAFDAGTTTGISPVSGIITFSGISVNNGGDYVFDIDTDGSDNGVTIGGFAYSTPLSATSSTISVSDANSDVIENATFDYPEYIEYLSYQDSDNLIDGDATEIVLARFDIRDGGESGDSDTKVTRMQDFEITVTSGGSNLNKVALYTVTNTDGNDIAGGTKVGEFDVSDESNILTFDLDKAVLNNDFSINEDFDIPDDGSVTVELRGSFNSAPADINDQEQLTFTVTSTTADTGGGRSGFGSSDGTPVSGASAGVTPASTSKETGDNLVEVVSDRLILTSDNASSSPFERNSDNINIIVEARDINGNIDLDEISQIRITGPADFDGSSTTTFDFNLAVGTASPSFTIFGEEEDLILNFTDNDGNTGSRTNGTTITNSTSLSAIDVYDTTPATVSAVTPTHDPIFATPITLTNQISITFNEDVIKNAGSITAITSGGEVLSTSVSSNNVVVSGATATVTLPGFLEEGSQYYVLVPNGSFLDANDQASINGSNGGFAGYSNTTSWNFVTAADNVAPTVTISRQSTSNGDGSDINIGTSDGTVTYDIAFNEPMTVSSVETQDFQLALTNVDIGGTGSGTTVTADNFGSDITLTSVDDQNWTLTISSITINTTGTDGSVALSIPAGAVIQDGSSGTNNLAVAFDPGVDGIFYIDRNAPDLAITLANPALGSTSGTTSSSLAFNLAFDSDIDGSTLTTADFTVNATGTVGFTGLVLSGASPNYVLTVNGVSGDGNLGISITTAGVQDDSGNDLSATGATSTNFVVDNTLPTVAISRQSPADEYITTAELPAVFELIFSEGVTAVDINDFEIAGTAVGTIDPSLNSVSTTTYRVTSPSVSNDGTIDLNFAGGAVITDLAGNQFLTTAISTEETFILDDTNPTVVLNDNHADGIVKDADEVIITAVITETNGLSATPTITIGTLITNAAMTAVGNGTDFTYTWDVPSGNFTGQAVTITGTDLSGNAIAAPTAGTGPISYDVDNTVPALSGALNIGTISPAFTGTGALVGQEVRISFTVNEDLASNPSVTFYSGASDSNPGIANGTVTIGGVAPNYTATYTINGLDNSGDVYYDIQMTDVAGNSTTLTSRNLPATITTITGSAKVDAETPEIEDIVLTTLTQGSTSSTTQNNIEYTITFSETIDNATFSYADDITLNATGVTVPTPTVSFSTVGTSPVKSVVTLNFAFLDNSGDDTFSFNIINNGSTPITDGVGNTIDGSGIVATSESIRFDHTIPTATITASTPSSGSVTNTNADILSFAIVFSEPIDDATFTLDDITLNNPDGNVRVNGQAPDALLASNSLFELSSTNVISLTNSGNNTNYTLSIGNSSIGDGSGIITGNGNLGITISSSGIQDAADNFYGGGTSANFTVDNNPPTLDALTIVSTNTTDNKHARPTEDVILTMNFDDDLSSSPTVAFRSGGVPVQDGTIVYFESSDFTNDGDEIWTATYTVDADDFEGDVDFTLTYTDDAGNAGTTLDKDDLTGGSTTTVEIDKTAPTLTAVSIASNNTAGLTDHAVAGNTVTLSFTSSDDLSVSPTVDFTSGGDVVSNNGSVNVTNTSGNNYTASYQVDGGDTDGNVGFTINFVDDAGTSGVAVTSTIGGSFVEVDKIAPVLSNVSLSTNNTTDQQHGIAGNTVTLTFDINDDLSALATLPTVVMRSGGVDVTDTELISSTGGNSYQVTYVVNSSDTDGAVTFEIDYTDDAGNAGATVTSGGNPVEIDKIAPTLDALTIVSTNITDNKHARPTEDVTLTMNFDDDLTSAPTVAFRSGGVPVQDGTIVYFESSDFTNDGDEIWTATYTVDADDFEGDVDFTLTYTDDAGNAGTTLDKDDLTGGSTTTVEIDKTAPTLTAVSIASNNTAGLTDHAVAGNTVTLSFTSSDDLSVSPTVDFTSGGDVVSNNGSVNVTNTSGNNYTASYQVDGGDTDGNVGFTINFVDDAGTSGVAVTSTIGGSFVEVDKIAPVLSNVSLSTNNTTDQQHGIAGNTVTLTFDINDDLSALATLPTVVMRSGGVDVTDTELISSTGGNSYQVTYVVNSSDTDGAVTFEIDYTDDAGNAGATVTSGGNPVEIDKIAPTLDALTLVSTNTTDNKHARPTEDVTLTMNFDDDLTSAPTVAFRSGGVPVQDGTIVYFESSDFTNDGDEIWTATYTVDADDFEGDVDFTLTYTDDAGNAGTTLDKDDLTGGSTTTVEIDKTAPTLTAVSIASNNTAGLTDHAVAGNTVTLSFTSSDDLSVSPTVDFTSGGDVVSNNGSVNVTNTSGNNYTASYQVDGGDTDGNVGFTINFVDDAGTSGVAVTSTIGGSFVEVDKIAPVLSNVSLSTNNTTDQQHGIAGNTVTLTFDINDDLSALATLPTVVMRSGGVDVTDTELISSTGGNSYQVTYVVNSSDTDGAVTFEIDYTDDAGNAGATVTSGGNPVEIDKIAPTLDALTIVSTNITDNKHARPTEDVILTMNFDDDLSSSPTVAFRSGGVPVQDGTIVYFESSDFTNDGDEIWTATYTVDADDFEGDVDFTLTYTDDAGNAGTTLDKDDLTGGSTTTVEIDKTAPTLTAVSIASNNTAGLTDHAVAGNTVTLSFTSSDDLSVSPTVDFTSGGDVVSNNGSVNVTNTSGNNYTASYQVDGGDTDGNVGFTINFVDDAGTSGVAVTSTIGGSFVEVDKIAPVLSNVSLSTNNTTDQQHGIAGNTVTLTFDINDDLSALATLPTVVMRSGGVDVTDTELISSTGGNSYQVTYVVNSSDTDGAVTFEIDYTDDAGNAGATVTSGGNPVEIDKIAPTLDALTIVSTNTTDNKHARPTEDVTLTMNFDDDLTSAPTVAFRSGGVPVQDGTIVYSESSDFTTNGDEIWTATYTVDADDFEGDVDFTLTYTDDAGNAGTTLDKDDLTGGSTTTVEIDKTAPTLTAVSIASNNTAGLTDHAVAGNAVTLSFTSSDDLSITPTVDFTSGGDVVANNGSVNVTNTSGNNYTASYQVVAGDTDGSVGFTISFVDDAGNTGMPVSMTTNESIVEIDKVAPTVTYASFDTDNGIDSLHVTTGDEVALFFDIDDDLSANDATPTVVMRSGGDIVTGVVEVEVADNAADADWVAYYTVSDSDTDGLVTFTIDFTDDAGNSGTTVSVTTDNSEVEVDQIAPTLLEVLLWTDNNTDDQHGTDGNEVFLEIVADDEIIGLSVTMNSGDLPTTDDVNTVVDGSTTIPNSEFSASYIVDGVGTLGINKDDDGLVTFSISFQDDAGNIGTAVSATTDGSSVEIDYTNPFVTFSNSLQNPSNENPFTISADFDEVITGLANDDFTVTNGSVSNITGTSPNYTIEITPTSPLDNNVSVVLNASAVIDDAGNANAVSSTYQVDFDDVPPVITSSVIVQGREISLTAQLDEPGTIYYVVVADGTSVTSLEVKNIDGAAASPIASGNITFTTGGISLIENISLDADRTNYDLYLVSEDNIEESLDDNNLLANPVEHDITSGGVTINTPSLADICLEGDFFTIPDIVITETISTDFNRSTSNRSLIIELPENFLFQDAGIITVNTGSEVTVVSSTLNNAKTFVTLTYKVAGEAVLDVLTLSSLEVMASGSTTVSAEPINRSGGNGDIYGINDENENIPAFATLTTVAPFAVPDLESVMPTSATNPYIIQKDSVVYGDALTDAATVYDQAYVNSQGTAALTPFSVGAINVGDIINIYNTSDLSLTPQATLTTTTANESYAPTLDDLGLTAADLGVNTFYIAVQNKATVNSCESGATKYSVAIIATSNSQNTTTFASDDQEGTILKFSNPAGSSASLSGSGLALFNSSDDINGNKAFSAKFLPSSVDADRYTLQYSLTNAEGETASYWLEILVNATGRVVSQESVGTSGLCADDDQLSFVVNQLQNIDFNNVETTDNPDFYTIRVFNYDGEAQTRGTSLTSTYLVGAPDTAVVASPTDSTGWILDLDLAKTEMETNNIYRKQIELAFMIADEATETLTELTSEVITIYRNPTVTFQNLTNENYYCEDDGAFDIRVQVVSDAGTITRDIDDTGYSLYKFDGSDFNTLIGTFTNLAELDPKDLDRDGIDYLSEDETGQYKIIYTSANYTNAECATTIESTFTLLSKPEQPLFSTDLTAIGALNETTGEYLLEYCEGETVKDLVGTIDPNNTDVKFTWYNDAGKSSEITEGVGGGAEQTTLNVATALFGNVTAPRGRQTKTIYFTITDHTASEDANGRFGCESEVRKVVIEIYPIPEQPLANELTTTGSFSKTNEYNSAEADDEYFFEYCVEEEGVVTIQDIVIDASLNTEQRSESYFILYDSVFNRLDSFQTTGTVDYRLVESDINNYFEYSKAASTSLSFYLSQKDHDNNYPAAVNDAQFQGCESEKRKFNIIVYTKPKVPVASNFRGGSGGYVTSDGVVQYYVCSEDALSDLTTPTQALATQLFTWYADGSPMNFASFGDRSVTQSELETQGGFSNINNGTANNTYEYKVTQTFDRNQSTNFGGCESDSTTVHITVFPDPVAPTIKETVSAIPTTYLQQSYCAGAQADSTYTIRVNGGASLKIYSISSATDFDEDLTRGNLIETIVADETGIINVSSSDLSSVGIVQDRVLYFKLSQQSQIDVDGSIFAGCETEIVDMARIKFNIFNIPANPIIADNTLFYCDSENLEDIVINNVEVGSQIEWFYGDGSSLIQGENAATSAILAAANLNISSSDSVYGYSVRQRTDIGGGEISTFEGCVNNNLLDFEITRVRTPLLDDLNVNTTGATCEYEFTPTSTTINYSGITNWLGEGSETYFTFYQKDRETFLTNGERVTAGEPTDPSAFFINLSNDANKLEKDSLYEYYVTQTTGVLASEQFEGCTSDFDLTTFQTRIEPDAPELYLTTNPNLPFNGTLTSSSVENSNTVRDYEFTFCNSYSFNNDIFSVANAIEGETYTWYDGPTVLVEGAGILLNSIADELNNFDTESKMINRVGDQVIRVATSRNGCITQNAALNEITLSVGEVAVPQFRWSNITAADSNTILEIRDNNDRPRNNGDEVTSTGIYITDNLGVLLDSALYLRTPFRVNNTARTYNYNLFEQFPDINFSAGDYGIMVDLVSSPSCIQESYDSIPRIITLLESRTLAESYEDNFDSDDNGWYVDTRDYTNNGYDDRATNNTPTSWAYNSDGFWETSNGNSADEDGFFVNEHSWVMSPAYNTLQMQNALLSVKVKYDFERFRDGVVLQFSVDDGATWQRVGSYSPDPNITGKDLSASSGVNWYLNNDISSEPGQYVANSSVKAQASLNGWSDPLQNTEGVEIGGFGNDDEFVTAINNIPEAESLRFRFALGSNGDEELGGGFKFDDFRIFDVDKTPLVETFNSLAIDSDTKTALDAAADLLSNQSGFVWINYFTDLATFSSNDTIDVLYNANKSGPSARVGYYGISELPATAIDGDIALPPTNSRVNDPNYNILGWNENIRDKALLQENKFRILEALENGDENTINLTVEFQSLSEDINEFSIKFAVIETEVTGVVGTNYVASEIIPNVMRKMLPTPDGIVYTNVISASDPVFSETVTWSIANVFDPSKLAVIVFIQDDISKEILQAKQFNISGKALPPLANKEYFDATDSYLIYPNPGNDFFVIQLPLQTKEELNWSLYDQSGKIVRQGLIKKGVDHLRVEAEELPSGVYMLEMQAVDKIWPPSRVIILH